MIDLKEKNTEASSSQAFTPTKQEKFTSDKEANARKLLSIMLAAIVAFVGIFCIIISRRNRTIEAQQKIAAIQSSTPSEAVNTVPPSPSATNAHPQTVVNGGTIENPVTVTIDEANWNLIIVNSGYRIPAEYEPDLVYVCSSQEQLDRKAATHYEAMYNAALKDGVTLTPCSGYRSYETQERNFNRKVEFFEGQGFTAQEAKMKAATIVVPPGSSEHNLGYSMDIVCMEEWFEGTEEFKWLQKNAADFGFIMRYPKDKQDITNVVYKPWHWRYVGVEAAKEMKANGQVLEEYMGATQ